MTIAEFLLARIAEDEEVARVAKASRVLAVTGEHGKVWFGNAEREHLPGVVITYDPARVLAECEAKRRIVATYPAKERWVEDRMLCEAEPRLVRAGWDIPPALLVLAEIYFDHSDYDPAWRP